jgi:hypothetical protein
MIDARPLHRFQRCYVVGELSNNAAERAVRGIAVGRRNWTFAGSNSGGRRAAAIYTLIETCKLNDVDPRAWARRRARSARRSPFKPPRRADALELEGCQATGTGQRRLTTLHIPHHEKLR